MNNHARYSSLPFLSLPQDGTTRRAALARVLRDSILSGALKRGERLPSTRALAHELKLSRNTVVQALDRLSAEGLIEGRMGAGTFVCANPVKLERISAKRQVSSRLASLREPVDSGKITQPLTPGIPALDIFPKQIWGRLASRWARNLSFSELGYGDPAGMPALRQAIARYIGTTRGVACQSEQVIITSGSQGGISTAVFLTTSPGDIIGIENPGYPAVRNTMALAGLKTKPVLVDGSGLVTESLDQETRAVLVAPSHHYPLGVTMSMDRRLALLNWAHRCDGWIIEDDYDGEYRYNGHPLPALASLDKTGSHVLYVGTLSKVLSPSIRLGFVVVPDVLIDSAAKIRAALDRSVSAMVQAISADFIDEGHLALHIRKTHALYAERRAELIEQLLKLDLTPLGTSAGLHMTLAFGDKMDDRALARHMMAQGLGGNALSGYYNDKAKVQKGLVMGFANAGSGIAERARHALEAFMGR